MSDLPVISRAKTCQNCKFGKFDKRNEVFSGGGKKINGLCMKYADAKMPRHFDAHLYVAYSFGNHLWQGKPYTGKHPVELQFKNARTLDDLPTWADFREAVRDNPYYRYQPPSEETILGWYDGCITWSAWWIRNWQTVAERKIDRTTVCDEWDGTQTSKFYREPKRRK